MHITSVPTDYPTLTTIKNQHNASLYVMNTVGNKQIITAIQCIAYSVKMHEVK